MTSGRLTFPDCFRSESCYHTMPGFDLKPSLVLSGRQHSAAMLFVDKTLRILPARHWGGGFGVHLSVSVRQIGRYGKFQTFLSPLWALCNPAATPLHHSQRSPAGLGSEGLVPRNSQHLTPERISLLQTLLISGCVVYVSATERSIKIFRWFLSKVQPLIMILDHYDVQILTNYESNTNFNILLLIRGMRSYLVFLTMISKCA